MRIFSTNKYYIIKGDIKENKETLNFKGNINILQEEISLSDHFDPHTITFLGKLDLEGDAKNLRNFIPTLNIDDHIKHKLTLNINVNKNLVKVTDIDINFGTFTAKGISQL